MTQDELQHRDVIEDDLDVLWITVERLWEHRKIRFMQSNFESHENSGMYENYLIGKQEAEFRSFVL